MKTITRHTIAIFAALISTHLDAANVSGGALTLNIDRNKLIDGVILDRTPAPSIYVEEFFDASAASRTFTQITNDNTPDDLQDYVGNEISANGLQFAVNGETIAPNPSRRENRPTSFTFDPNDLFGTAAGNIGLGGVIRFRVDVPPPANRVMLGDMTLDYDPLLEGATPGRSGWVLRNHIGFDAGAFNLFDVTTNLTENTLSLSGELGLGDGFDHLGGKRDTRVGTFSFQTTVVPLPATVWLFVTGVSALLFNGRSKGKKVL
jgi:hypothetical protein